MADKIISSAGSLESCDAHVIIQEAEADEPIIEIESIVIKQFGGQIRQSVREVLDAFGVRGVRVQVRDRGAYDCTLRARVEAAVLRYREAGR